MTWSFRSSVMLPATSHAEESVTLVECANDSAAALQALSDGFSFVNTDANRQGMVAVVDGTKLVYTAPPKVGMTIMIR